VAKARIGPEWVAATITLLGDSSTRRVMADQKRRTHDTGGSKWSIGMVSQWWMGSAPATWVRQKRSISTSHRGRSPSATRS
jgi:hypothetical protein